MGSVILELICETILVIGTQNRYDQDKQIGIYTLDYADHLPLFPLLPDLVVLARHRKLSCDLRLLQKGLGC